MINLLKLHRPVLPVTGRPPGHCDNREGRGGAGEEESGGTELPASDVYISARQFVSYTR